MRCHGEKKKKRKKKKEKKKCWSRLTFTRWAGSFCRGTVSEVMILAFSETYIRRRRKKEEERRRRKMKKK